MTTLPSQNASGIASFKRVCQLILASCLLFVLAGCTDEKRLGLIHDGRFIFERIQITRHYPDSTSFSEYTRIRHGFFRTLIHFPNDSWDLIDDVMRLPGPKSAWLISVGEQIGVLTETNGRAVIKRIWTNDMGAGSNSSIQRIDQSRWYIPDQRRLGEYPNFQYRGGQIFDAETLSLRWLPLMPVTEGPFDIMSSGYDVSFLAVSPDETTVAWLVNKRTRAEGQLQVLVSDGQQPQVSHLAIENSLWSSNPLPRIPWPGGGLGGGLNVQPVVQQWFDSLFRWDRNEDGRWRLERR